ncbi:unnamed protein product [Linum tenue]|uniref:Uncharacterized protein n=1 Tax=Linum tenue TaxID=586396 RepID=A0AAV0MY48_9ROSI|nr:unnamed protein product [Linum tenue]
MSCSADISHMQLLTEMDGFDSDMRVVVVAATNRPKSLDPALCRAWRFSRKVFVGEPDEEGRRKILAIHLRGVPLEEDVGRICDLVAPLTPGLVGADLANIVNEAVLLAGRRGGETVVREDVLEAIERAKLQIPKQKTNDKAVQVTQADNREIENPLETGTAIHPSLNLPSPKTVRDQ